MIGVGSRAVADDFSDGSGLSGQSMLQFLDHENASAFTHDEAIPVAVKRAGRARRHIVEARRKRTRGGEASEADQVDASFRASANCNLRFSGPDQARCIANGLYARGAGGYRRAKRSFIAVANRDMSGRK